MSAPVFWYLDEYADEVLPSHLGGTQLANWAEWLAKGGDEGGAAWSFDPPADGTVFQAERLTLREPIQVRRIIRDDDNEEADELEFPDGRPSFNFAVQSDCYSWSVDNFLDPDDLADGLIDNGLNPGETTTIVVGTSEPVVLVYRADPSRLELAQ